MKRFQVLMALLCLIHMQAANVYAECPHSKLLSPSVAKIYAIKGKERPIFKWELSESSSATFRLEIFRGEDKVLTKATSETQYWDLQEIESIFEENASSPTPYTWRVITESGDNCEPTFSESSTFYVIATAPLSILSGGVEVDLVEVECNSPAFTSGGNVSYRAKVNLSNLPSSFNTWDIQSYTNQSGTSPVTSLIDCVPPNTPQGANPLVLAAGTSATWCYVFSLPMSNTGTYFTANGTMGGYPSIVTDIINLPECLCKYCEEWQYDLSGKSELLQLTSQSPNFEILQDFVINNADPIREMRAEVISVYHKVGAELCQVCVENASKMGAFPYSLSANLPRDLRTGWQNSNVALAGLDSDSDGYTNQLIWTAANQLTGIDFSTLDRRFRIPISLPDHALECCESTYQVCVRYTFTDINCKTCDLKVCYELNL